MFLSNVVEIYIYEFKCHASCPVPLRTTFTSFSITVFYIWAAVFMLILWKLCCALHCCSSSNSFLYCKLCQNNVCIKNCLYVAMLLHYNKFWWSHSNNFSLSLTGSTFCIVQMLFISYLSYTLESGNSHVSKWFPAAKFLLVIDYHYMSWLSILVETLISLLHVPCID